MRTTTALAAATLLIALTATHVFAQSGAAPAARPQGDRAQVERAQKALKDAGHDPGTIDGVMGAKTTAALKAYQRQQGLDASGQLDDATLAKLASGQAAASPSSTQSGGDQKPSSVDPAQSTKTGANVGEGASYSRSNEKK